MKQKGQEIVINGAIRNSAWKHPLKRIADTGMALVMPVSELQDLEQLCDTVIDGTAKRSRCLSLLTDLHRISHLISDAIVIGEHDGFAGHIVKGEVPEKNALLMLTELDAAVLQDVLKVAGRELSAGASQGTYMITEETDAAVDACLENRSF